MTSETSQQTVDSELLQNLQAEIQQEFVKSLKKGNFTEIVEKYGVPEKIIKFQCIIDFNKIPNHSDSLEKQEIIESTQKHLFQMPSKIVKLDWCPPEGMCTSP
ncbi:MAG: hypothetical protein RMY62_023935 [Nostoc sp. ZfuVER08]|jgi:hypothetical protein|uniref:Uncharacterized protein n=1 Tax=Nostoc punctiforme FACHB-252 TaxID=1357509 RepID=A0ABR8H6A9_NOSPU|nr:hypothetical protein [Nostoc punctiforme]MBD2610797.1 hypothetical protein [Nostoc punctiforme FACHB-252]MDZ8013696.1 hypothetical protein [Nostoc sp. ZfuVER08]